MLCEGYLGIEPHLNLWRYFFCISLHTRREHDRPKVMMPMGCAGIRLRNNQAKDYISMKLLTSNKGWHS
jgi:hypothetical protein